MDGAAMRRGLCFHPCLNDISVIDRRDDEWSRVTIKNIIIWTEECKEFLSEGAASERV